MTLNQLIEQATVVSKRLSSGDIPVVFQGVSDNITRIELSQDNDGNYYAKIM